MIRLKGEFLNEVGYVDEIGEVVVENKKFPDGALLLHVEDERKFTPYELIWHYESDAELFTVICLSKKFNLLDLYLPYIPHARMDRVKNNTDVFTLKYFAEIINSLDFYEIRVLDPHSNVSAALIDGIEIESPQKYIERTIETINENKAPLIFYPDEGSVKRYNDMIKLPYAFGIKKRDWNTGEILNLDVIGAEKVTGRDILIVDDICSKGGTFLHSAKKLKELGANKIYLYVTHCENTILEGDLLTSGLIERVFTTNSIFNKKHEMIEVFELN